MLTRKVTAVIQQVEDSGGKKKIQNKMAREVGLSGVRVETSGDHLSSLGAVIIGTAPCVVIYTVWRNRDTDDRNHCSLPLPELSESWKDLFTLGPFMFRLFCWHFEAGSLSVAQAGLQIA